MHRVRSQHDGERPGFNHTVHVDIPKLQRARREVERYGLGLPATDIPGCETLGFVLCSLSGCRCAQSILTHTRVATSCDCLSWRAALYLESKNSAELSVQGSITRRHATIQRGGPGHGGTARPPAIQESYLTPLWLGRRRRLGARGQSPRSVPVSALGCNSAAQQFSPSPLSGPAR